MALSEQSAFKYVRTIAIAQIQNLKSKMGSLFFIRSRRTGRPCGFGAADA